MALIRAMNTAISGLRAQQNRISIIGDNLANSTTTGFKAGRAMFETLLSQTVSFGTAPSGFLGGVDPMQIGLGVQLGDTTKNFNQGVLEATGIHSDLAIEGEGFFVMNDVDGGPVYTRDGSFTINPENKLHNSSNGFIVQGWNADLTTFEIPVGAELEDLEIPIGDLRIANATTEAVFDGNLNGGGAQALEGTVLETQSFRDVTTGNAASGTTLLTDLGRRESFGPPAQDTDLQLQVGDIIEVRIEKGSRTLPTARFLIDNSPNPNVDAAGMTLQDFIDFLEAAIGTTTSTTSNSAGDLVYGAMRRVETGNPPFPMTGVAENPAGLALTATSVMDDGRDFVAEGAQIGDIIRFNTGPGAGQDMIITGFGTTNSLNDTIVFAGGFDPELAVPTSGSQFSVHENVGISIGTTAFGATTPNDTIDGGLRIAGNIGTANEITRLQIVAGGQSLTTITQLVEATGESMLSNAAIYDSLGNAHTVELTMVLESQGAVSAQMNTPGNVWRYFGECADQFKIANAPAGTFIPLRTVGTGQVTFDVDGKFLFDDPLNSINITLNNTGAATPVSVNPDFTKMTGFDNKLSEMSLVDQDGFRQGTLSDFSIGADGVVVGIFSNGMTRNVAQIPIARFNNNNGLEAIGTNLYREAANSGIPIVGAAGSFGRGMVRGGYLEESNVDFAIEFTNLIVSQRAFQANAKTISTSNELLQDLVNL